MAATLSYQSEKSSAVPGGTGVSAGLFAFTVANAAGQERLLALCGISGAYTTANFGSVNIDGQAATQVGAYIRATDGGVNGPIVSFWRAAGTVNTTIDVTFTVSNLFDARGYIWTLSNAGTLLASASATDDGPVSTTNLNLNVNTAANGAAAAAVLFYNTTTQAVSWTGLTERFQGHNLYGNDQDSAADANISSASTPLTVSANFGAGDFTSGSQAIAALAVSFNPAAGAGTTLTAAAGSYALTGSLAGLVVSSNVALAAAAGVYTLTGTPALFVRSGSVTLTAASGHYVLTGKPALLLTKTPRVISGVGTPYDTFVVLEEIRLLVIAPEDRTIEVPGEIRVIEVQNGNPGK